MCPEFHETLAGVPVSACTLCINLHSPSPSPGKILYKTLSYAGNLQLVEKVLPRNTRLWINQEIESSYVSTWLTLLAYFKELRFSAKLTAAGLRHVIIAVRAFPPKESFNSLVILDSRYGTWEDFRFGSPRALMTLPSARRPLLMCTDSVEHMKWRTTVYRKNFEGEKFRKFHSFVTVRKSLHIAKALLFLLTWDFVRKKRLHS